MYAYGGQRIFYSLFPHIYNPQTINTHGSPEGHRLCEPYQNPDVGRLAPESVESFSYDWRRVWDEVEVPHYEGGSRVVGKNDWRRVWDEVEVPHYEGGSRVVGKIKPGTPQRPDTR